MSEEPEKIYDGYLFRCPCGNRYYSTADIGMCAACLMDKERMDDLERDECDE